MRTVDADLTTALTSANYHPYAKVICLVDTLTWETHDPIYYELTATKCKVMFKKQTYVTCQSFVIERGAIIAGVETGLTTGTFYPLTAVCEDEIVTIEGSLFRNVLHLSVAGNFSHSQVITDICTEYDKTAVLKDPMDTYWDNEFLEAGKYLDINNPDHFLSIIRQKHLYFAVDNGEEEVLFYYPAKTFDSGDANWTVNPTRLIYSAINTKRNICSVDENDNFVLAYAAGAYSLYPRHNLGYVKSTDSMPRYSYPAGSFVRVDNQYFKFIMKPDLRWQDGDSFTCSTSGVLSRILVKEVWNHKHSPAWQMEISGIQYFQGTEAGNMPADMLNVAPFIPLYTGEFDGILSDADSYVQHALDTLDDHAHDAAYSAITHNHDADYTPLSSAAARYYLGADIANIPAGIAPGTSTLPWTTLNQLIQPTGMVHQAHSPSRRSRSAPIYYQNTEQHQPAGKIGISVSWSMDATGIT